MFVFGRDDDDDDDEKGIIRSAILLIVLYGLRNQAHQLDLKLFAQTSHISENGPLIRLPLGRGTKVLLARCAAECVDDHHAGYRRDNPRCFCQLHHDTAADGFGDTLVSAADLPVSGHVSLQFGVAVRSFRCSESAKTQKTSWLILN